MPLEQEDIARLEDSLSRFAEVIERTAERMESSESVSGGGSTQATVRQDIRDIKESMELLRVDLTDIAETVATISANIAVGTGVE